MLIPFYNTLINRIESVFASSTFQLVFITIAPLPNCFNRYNHLSPNPKTTKQLFECKGKVLTEDVLKIKNANLIYLIG